MSDLNYFLYDDHEAFRKRFVAANPPCYYCGNSGYYLCASKDCGHAGHNTAHPCACIQGGYVIHRENRWYRRCKTNGESYTFGGWKLISPEMVPGVMPYRGTPVTLEQLLGDPVYEPFFVGLDDVAMARKMQEIIYGTADDRKYLERQSGPDMKAREKNYHLVEGIPWCNDHQRPLHLREGESEYGAYAFYSCAAQTGSGYCPVRVNRSDLR